LAIIITISTTYRFIC